MNQPSFDELIMAAAEKPTQQNLGALLQLLRNTEGGIPTELTGQLHLLWESWNSENMEAPAANFCLEAGALAIPANASFRAALGDAIKFLLPPYLSRTPFMRALGLRDEAVPGNEIVWRFRKLSALKNGTILFRNGSWSVAGIPDSISGSLPVTPFGRSGSSAAVPMELVLKEAALLSPGLEINRITDPVRAAAMTGAAFREAVRKRALSSVSDTQMRNMALSSAGKKMTPDEFNAWWNAECPATAGQNGSRRSCDGRSIAEVDLLLDKETGAGGFSSEEVAAFTQFFTDLKPEVAVREAKNLARVVARICIRTAAGDRPGLFRPLCGKAPFWPEHPAQVPLARLAVWGELSAKDLESLASATASVFDADYLAECALRLPLKALNPVCEATPDEVLYCTLNAVKSCYADLLLWIWKNRKKHSDELLQLVNLENVIRALSQDNLPKAWGAAQRELRTALLDKADFQKQLIESSGDDAGGISSSLQGALFLSPGERQSLLVKLSRHSEALRDHIEGGAGQKILNAGLKSTDRKISVPAADALTFTSIQSHARLMKELDDIINLHVPENREALKAARAHGDFRENAEFDAAKERRNFLSRRRSELERELSRIQPVSFRRVKVDDTAVIGSQITLEDPADGEIAVYCLLGAWDGNPDKHYLSYLTRLGQAILNRRVGEKIPMPNGSVRVLKAVGPLPAETLAEME